MRRTQSLAETQHRLNAMGTASRVRTSLIRWEESRPNPRGRIKTFRDRVPWLGPFIWILSVLYFVVQVWVAQVWEPSYSWLHNTISDLGNTHCGPTVCSPRHEWMNWELFLLGLAMAIGSILIFQEFTEKRPAERLMARLGFACLVLGGLGAILVARYPENTVSWLHILGAAGAIGVGTLGILVLGWGLDLPARLRWVMRVAAPLALGALILFATHSYLGLGAGSMERLAAYPEAGWLIVFGVYISHTHSRKPDQNPPGGTSPPPGAPSLTDAR